MKKNRLEKFKTKTESPISKSEHRRNCELIVDNFLMPVVDKLRNSPEPIRPVSESWQDLINELNNGVKRQPTIIQTDNGVQVPAENTKIISGGDTEKVSQSNTILNADDLKILETLK